MSDEKKHVVLHFPDNKIRRLSPQKFKQLKATIPNLCGVCNRTTNFIINLDEQHVPAAEYDAEIAAPQNDEKKDDAHSANDGMLANSSDPFEAYHKRWDLMLATFYRALSEEPLRPVTPVRHKRHAPSRRFRPLAKSEPLRPVTPVRHKRHAPSRKFRPLAKSASHSPGPSPKRQRNVAIPKQPYCQQPRLGSSANGIVLPDGCTFA